MEKGVLLRDAKRAHRKSASVTFDAPEKERGRAGLRDDARSVNPGPDLDEVRRKERRRSEAKAAIEVCPRSCSCVFRLCVICTRDRVLSNWKALNCLFFYPF